MKNANPFIQANEVYSLVLFSVERYELECYLFERKPNSPVLYIRNIMTEEYHRAGDFFLFNWGTEEIKDDLLPTIDDVVERNWGEELLVGEIVSAIVEPETTFFKESLSPDTWKAQALADERLQMLTSDFRAISLKWLEYLEGLNKG